MKTLTRAILATSLVAGLGFSQTALAASDQDTLEITAGISAAITVTCGSALSFGITRVQLDNRGGNDTITVDPSDGAITSDGSGNVTTGTGAAGECSVSGSQASDNTKVGVNFATAEDLKAAPTLDLSGASTAISDLSVGSFKTTTGTDLDLTKGATSFGIGGTLAIPDNVVADNLGGYTSTVVVTVDDSPAGAI